MTLKTQYSLFKTQRVNFNFSAPFAKTFAPLREIRHAFFLTFILFPLSTFSCECEGLDPLKKESLLKYHLIFQARVDSISTSTSTSTNNKCIAWFTITELYNGDAPAQLKLLFDCKTECQMNFNVKEDWLIYANYVKYSEAEVNGCSRSRKKFNDDTDDYYVVTNGSKFFDEIKFLKDNFGIQNIQTNKQTESVIPERKNIQPDPMDKLYLIIFSLLCVGVIYFIFKRWVK